MVHFDTELLSELESANDSELSEALDKIYLDLERRYAFPELTDHQKDEFSSVVRHRVSQQVGAINTVKFLQIIRALSRDGNGIDALISDKTTEMLVVATCCTRDAASNATSNAILDPENHHVTVAIEASKCLSNALFHSTRVRDLFIASGSFDAIIKRIIFRVDMDPNTAESEIAGVLRYSWDVAKDDNNNAHCYDLRYFDLRLAFIVSACSREIQRQLREDLRAIGPLTTLVERALCSDGHSENMFTQQQKQQLAADSMKLLFNALCHADRAKLTDDEEGSCAKLVAICSSTVKHNASELPSLSSTTTTTSTTPITELVTNSVNLLATVPWSAHQLCPPLNDDDDESTGQQNADDGQTGGTTFEGVDVSFVHSMLILTEHKLTQVEKGETELVVTYLTVLTMLAMSCKEARRYIRLKVLPPLSADDVASRPEEGDSLRSKLVRLMTGTSAARELAAELMFVLCKRSVGRLVKYTGFGNCAGLLANRGLLGHLGSGKSASDSEDSDTESYQEVSNRVNPVVGCIEEDRPNPINSMSDEQKEYEAMKLVDCMNKLMNEGVFQPGTVGEDGRPRPVSHVLEMKERIMAERAKRGERTSDDDEQDSD